MRKKSLVVIAIALAGSALLWNPQSDVDAAAAPCSPTVIDIPGNDICTASYPDNFVPFSSVYSGFSALCGGTAASVGIGYSNWPYVIFKSGPFVLNQNDTIQVRYVGWASGSTGGIQIKASVSKDGSNWFPCGTAKARNFLGNNAVDTLACPSPFSGSSLFVKLETTTTSPALIYIRSFQVDVPQLCPTCQPDIGFDGPGNSVLSICGTGTTGTLMVTGAPAGTTGFLLASLGLNPTFVFNIGAILAPVPVTVLVPYGADANGELILPGVPLKLAAGPVFVYVQSVVVDPAQVMGFGASNAVRLEVAGP